MGSRRGPLGNEHRNVKEDRTKLSSVNVQCNSPAISPKKPAVLLGYRVELIWGCAKRLSQSSQVPVGPGQRLPARSQTPTIQAAVGQLGA